MIWKVVAAGSAVLLLLAWLFREPDRGRRGPVATVSEAEPDKAGVVARGWVAEGLLAPGERTRIRITFENREQSPVRLVGLVEFGAAGFRGEGTCWRKERPDCWSGGAPSGDPMALEPGSTATVTAVVKAPDLESSYRLTAAFAWTLPDKRVRDGVIHLGPVTVQSPVREPVRMAGAYLVGLAKDLAIPVLLVLLGWYVQTLLASRAEAQKIEEEHRIQLREVWTQQLPRIHEFAESYYMPIVRSLRVWATCAKAVKDGNVARQEECFFYLLLFLRRMKRLRTERASVFFKERKAEAVFSQTWRLLESIVKSHLGPLDLESTVALVSPTADYAEFHAQRLTWNAADANRASEVEDRLIQWIRGTYTPATVPFADCVPLIHLLRDVLFYETNRPFELWYGKRDELGVKDCVKSVEAVGARQTAFPGEEKFGERRAELEGYLKLLKQPSG